MARHSRPSPGRSQGGDVTTGRIVCPTCGNDDYMFMTPGETKAWERKKAKEAKP